VGTANLAGFNNTALWGLAVTAKNLYTNNVAAFDSLTVTQPPVIAPVANQTLIAGQTLMITNTATELNVPPLTLTWNLLSAPTGLTLGPTTGIFSWRPAVSQSPSGNVVTFSVTDSGTPPLSATQQFSVTVLRPATPAIAQTVVTNGAFALLVGGDAGPDYTLVGTTNLTPPISWQPLLTNTPASLPVWLTDPSLLTNRQFFYRVLLGP
jgi:hypothetical protein